MGRREAITALGVDVGGTRVRVGLVSAAGDVLARVESPLPRDGDPEALAQTIAEHARNIGAHALTPPTAAGVALPGVWDRDSGTMQRAINLRRLEGVNLPALMAKALGRAVHLETDVNAAMWGQWLRMEPPPARLVYLSLGTGVGGGVLLDGEIVRHTRGGAGHFGFLIADTSPDAPAGRNSVRGCLSAIAAGPALHLAATGKTDMSAIGDEPLPAAIIGRAARAVAVGVVQLVHIYAPEVVALGGGVIDHHPELVEATREAFGHYESQLIPAGFRIERAPLSSREAGVIGAALLALSVDATR